MDVGRCVYALMNLWLRTRRVGLDGRPWRGRLRGGSLLACNHNSLTDPLVLGSAFWYRRVGFLAAEAVMQGRLRTALLRGMGCIRIDRRISDLEGLRAAIDSVKAGRCLGVFPEGGVVDEETAHAVKGGAILIALQADAPVLPLYIHRPRRWYGRWTMVVGEALDPRQACGRRFPSVADIERAAGELQARMAACRETYERMMGGVSV